LAIQLHSCSDYGGLPLVSSVFRVSGAR
jgi:hypothetical protein